ncbi:MAG TPA: 4-hydroxyproline epimerase [Herpetosiphonaceae bacterium]|nr:4-hydroxyproline epimerase [Herpetosiphonaceae bacterium]
MQRIQIVDSHTGGEPTRVVCSGGPDLGRGTLAEQRERFQAKFDHFRRAIICEPRGSGVIVGAMLVPPVQPQSVAGAIFFNNVGYLGMCGHGTIGLIATLAYLGRIGPGEHRVETPVGTVAATLHADGRVSVQNVPSYRHLRDVTVEVAGLGAVRGDVAWGGNWFFLADGHGLAVESGNIEALTEAAWSIRAALAAAGISGAGGAEIDHIELFGPGGAGADSRSFVLCPGKAYDRSPCGTGTSAKLACLAAAGKLAPGAEWVQESVIGSRFVASYARRGDEIIPTITGRAYVTGAGSLLIDPADPFRWGIRP